ncbi:hypothetical protein [Streptomyces sp. NPDC059861]|uniref:hypothetical protein n=1 Tax=Streptomyces sp. NPDC059861 TaxID=3346974 RepID=UPI00365D8116
MPTSALAAPATPHAGTAATTVVPRGDRAEHGAPSAVRWVKSVDASSGISFALPGKSTPEKLESAGLHGRLYTVPTSDGFVYFLIIDMKGAGPAELKGLVEGTRQGIAEEYGDGTITSQKAGTMDSRPSLEARLTNTRDDLTVSATQTVTDDHVVQVLTVGSQTDERSVTTTHKHAVDSLRIP